MQPVEGSFFSQHIQTLCRHFEASLQGQPFDGVALYSGAPYVAFQDDYHFPFKANPLFAWWGPMAEPQCWICFEPGRKPQLVFLQPTDYWHAAPEDPNGFWVDEFDIHIISEPQQARDLLPLQGKKLAAIGENLPDWGFAETNPQRLIDALHWRRAAKTEYELCCLRTASVLGARAHEAARQAFFDGDSEYSIHLKYVAATGLAEKELPYNNIIALNEHAAILHYQHLDRGNPEDRRTFLIDAGATHAGYASDITRTWVNGDEEFAAIVADMDRRQQEMAQSVRPGVAFADLHLDCHRHLAQLMEQAGLITCSAETALETGITTTFMPHGLGHLIGLQVHDVGGHLADETGAKAPPPAQFPHLRTTRTLGENFVLTIEPGFYFIPMLLADLRASANKSMIAWDRVDRLTPFGGVRIEDDVVATAGAPENLTRDAFAQLNA